MVYGRRRIGKTFLIREFFDYNFAFELTGMANAKTAQQLVNFHNALLKQSTSTIESVPATWMEAFQRLITHLETWPANDQRMVIFLDELPWLDTPRSDFMMALEHFWNSWATRRKDIILVGCGSAASWMINKLINNRGGLHNRVTQRLSLQPFTLGETEAFLQAKNNVLDRYSILQLYMVTGGVPFYLDAISSDQSVAQNIEELCFRKGALLEGEFANLFSSLFRKSENHEAIVRQLATKTSGFSRNELLQALGRPSGGTASKYMLELEQSGFINRYVPFGKKAKDAIYRLADFYTSFYLRFIADNTNYEQGVWLHAIDHPRQRAWAGLAFEHICLAHIPQIKKALGISGILSQSSTWRDKGDQKGAQVDLVIDRRDHVINLCEMKYALGPYEITKSYAAQLRNKAFVFREQTGTRKSLFTTMITTYGLKVNKYSRAVVQSDLTMDALFE